MTAFSATAIAWALAFAVLAASARMLWRIHRRARGDRPRVARVAALLLLQAGSAALLYFVLFPPATTGEAGTLVVATGHADRARTGRLPPGDHFVAMPEAPALPGAERMPDLATALRRYPATTRIRVLGAGLVARDRDAARGHALDFRPAPLPRGLVALWPPRQVQSGRYFELAGRVEGVRGGTLELLDPGGVRVDFAQLADDGRFRLAGRARSAGLASWRLRLRDGGNTPIEQVELPLYVEPGAAPRVLLLAGAPNPEWKYLRRWASDTGVQLQSRISLGAGMQIGDAPAVPDADGLGEYDLVVLDQRAWRSLGDARRAALDKAVHGGLGLLLRLPDALEGADRARLRRLGFTATPAVAARTIDLPDAFAPRIDGDRKLPALTHAPLRVAAADGSPLLDDAGGTPLALWRAQGTGRIGVAMFDDSFRLVLGGHDDAYGALWSRLFSTLARAHAQPSPDIELDPRSGQRAVLCGLHDHATVDSPNGRSVALRIDPASGPRRCAGLWPQASGWHVLRDGDRRTPFYVRAPGDAPGLRAAALREATQQLAATDAPAGMTRPTPRRVPGPRWPWFLGWLSLAAALWWLERARRGASRGVDPLARP